MSQTEATKKYYINFLDVDKCSISTRKPTTPIWRKFVLHKNAANKIILKEL